jgi:retron-type reverse transcriptase
METLDIIKTKLQNNIQDDIEWLNEAYHLINVTIKQNYFKVNEKVWQQTDGTPMGSPISSILAEIFLQEIESRYYPNMIKNIHNILSQIRR